MADFEQFDPKHLFDQAIGSNFDPTIFSKIDEGDLPKAPNFFEFVVGQRFLNTTILPRQIQIATRFYGDMCYYCSNPSYADNLFDQPLAEIREHIQFLEFGKCPKCNKNRLDMWQDGLWHPSFELVLVSGMRSGKSKLVALMAAYQLHRYLSLPSPLQYFGLPTGEILVQTFSALDEDQANANLWLPFRAFYEAAPCFKEYNDFLTYHEQKLSMPLYKTPTSYIFYLHKSLYTSYTGSQHKQMRGRTRFGGYIDELGQFDKDASKKQHMMNADETHASLNNSLETLKNKCQLMFENGIVDIPIPIMANASSPLSKQDKIMRLYNETLDNKWMLGYHYGTHEFNPEYTEEKLRARHKDRNILYRDFFAIPPFSDSPFIEDVKALEKIVDPAIPVNIVRVKIEKNEDSFGDFTSYLAATCQVDKTTPRVLGVDTGYNNNAFAICMGRIHPKDNTPIVDVILRLQPSQNCPVHFPLMYEKCLVPLLESFNIKFAFFDRWNSIEQVQKMRDKKIDAQWYKLKFSDFLAIKTAIITRNLILPTPEASLKLLVEAKESPEVLLYDKPILSLCNQILTVREMSSKLLKPLDGDDDIFRAFSLCLFKMLDPEISKTLKTGAKPLFGRSSVVGVFKSKSGGGSSFRGQPNTTNIGVLKPRTLGRNK